MKRPHRSLNLLSTIVILVLSVGCGTSSNSISPPVQPFVYVSNLNSQNISAFKRVPINEILTPVAGSPFAITTPPTLYSFSQIEVDPNNQLLFSLEECQLEVFVIDPISGALSPASGSPFIFSTQKWTALSLSVDPKGRFVYVGTADSGLVAWKIDRTNRTLVPVRGSPFGNVGTSYSATVDPTGKFLYAAELYYISTFAIDPATGALKLSNGPFYIPGNEPEFITMHPSGNFAYVLGHNQELYPEVWDCMVNPANGAISAFQNEKELFPLALTPDGKFFFSWTGTYKVFDDFGELLTVSSTPLTSPPPFAIVVSPDNLFVYAITPSDLGTVSVFSFNEATGVTTQIPGSPYAVGDFPIAIAMTH